MNSYTRLHLDTSAENADLLSDLLTELGALSVELTGEAWIIEPTPGEQPLWPSVKLIACFQSASEAQDAWAQLLLFFPTLQLSHQDTLADQDWVTASQAQFPPQCIAETPWIYPAWATIPEAHQPVLRLSPGQAFGTGSHPTTAMCLEQLVRYVTPGMTVLDVGCGSGILALAALILGAGQVYATDIDPQAIETTLQNAAQNEYEVGSRFWAGLLAELPEVSAELIVANILLEPLMSLKELFLQRVRAGGRLIFSGVLAAQVDLLKQHYAPLQLEVAMEKEGWVCLVGVY